MLGSFHMMRRVADRLPDRLPDRLADRLPDRLPRSTALSAACTDDDVPWPAWLRGVWDVVEQSQLIETRPSQRALGQLERWRMPQAVIVGIGLCTRDQLSAGVPLDVLGLLLPAERIRRVIQGDSLVVVVADSHASTNQFDDHDIQRRAEHAVAVLEQLRLRLGLKRMRVIRASRFHRTQAYRQVYSWLEEDSPAGAHPYFKQELADVEYLDRQLGGIVKVGWAISGSASVEPVRDELAFDRRFQKWIGNHVGFVYCKAGRTFEDRRPKACPYTVLNPSRRICLDPAEDPRAKLEEAHQIARRSTIRGARKHLNAVCRAYSDLVSPLSGPLEDRLQRLVQESVGD